MWQPSNGQWVIIAATFLVAGFFSLLGGGELDDTFGRPTGFFTPAILTVIGGALVVWFLQGGRRKK